MTFQKLLVIFFAIGVLYLLQQIISYELTAAAEWLDANGGLRRIWVGSDE